MPGQRLDGRLQRAFRSSPVGIYTVPELTGRVCIGEAEAAEHGGAEG